MWKKFQDEIVHKRTFPKDAPDFFWLLVEDIKIPYIFYKIKNFQGPSWASIIATFLIKLLRTTVFVEQLLVFPRSAKIATLADQVYLI